MVGHRGRRGLGLESFPVLFYGSAKVWPFQPDSNICNSYQRNTGQTYEYKRIYPWQLVVVPCPRPLLLGLLDHHGLVHGLPCLRVHFQRKLQRYYVQDGLYPHIAWCSLITGCTRLWNIALGMGMQSPESWLPQACHPWFRISNIELWHIHQYLNIRVLPVPRRYYAAPNGQPGIYRSSSYYSPCDSQGSGAYESRMQTSGQFY